MHDLKASFLLDPSVVFLNHGSFGATPRPVFEAYREWQLRLERQPVRFLGRELDGLLLEARESLGAYLHAEAADLVFIPNATHGANTLARSLDLAPGDEVLTTDHEYGACDYTWEYICGRTGAKYVHRHIPLPVTSEEEIAARFLEGLTARTKVVYLSHITSPTALRLPVETICRAARERGILSIVDAAHSPGQIPLDLGALGADVVFGNCHKWMLSPKGAGFLYCRREVQDRVQPLIVSWGMAPVPEVTSGSRFIDILQWTGTRDPAAALSVPAAIRFMQENEWPHVRRECHDLLRSAIGQVCSLTGLEPPYPLDSDLYGQMGVAPLPPGMELTALKRRLYEEYRVEVPLIQWQDRRLMRISIQGYNTEADVQALLGALKALL